MPVSGGAHFKLGGDARGARAAAALDATGARPRVSWSKKWWLERSGRRSGEEEEICARSHKLATPQAAAFGLAKRTIIEPREAPPATKEAARLAHNAKRRLKGARRCDAALLLLAILCAIPAPSLCQSTLSGSSPTTSTTSNQPSSTSSSTTQTASNTTSHAQLEAADAAKISTSATDAPSLLVAQNSTTSHQVNKLKPVNFTLVDELFSQSLDDDELVRRWKHMDSQFQDGIRSILKLIFPQIVAISQDAKVSGDCSGGILKWILSLRNLRSWAIKMLDATGKPTSGIFRGSLTMMGNYGQCLGVRAPDEDEIEITDQFEEYFRGQYCVIHLRPPLPAKRPFYHLNTTIESLLRNQNKYYEKTLYDELAEIAIAFQFIDIRLDLCVPSTCTRADIQRVAELLSKKLEFRAKVLRCDIEPRDQSGTLGYLFSKDETVPIWTALPMVLVQATIVATILVALRRLRQTNADSGAPSRLGAIIYSFSIFSSVQYLFSTPKLGSNDQPKDERALEKPWPLYGLRNLFLIWYIIVQITIQLKYQYLRESLLLRDMLLNYWPLQIIVNTSMIFESLILITAFTYGYCNLDSSISKLFRYSMLKYLRIIPSMITIIAITIITPSLGIASPVWKNFVEEQATICKSTGYLNLFFLQNFISYEKICIPHSWLICVEFQLVVISIPFVALLRREFKRRDASRSMGKDSRKLPEPSRNMRPYSFSDNLSHMLKSTAGYLGVSIVLVGMAVNFFIVYSRSLPPTWFNTFPDAEDRNYYFGTYLAKTWTHLGTFVLGLMAGNLCRSTIQLRCNDSNSGSKRYKRDSDEHPAIKMNQEAKRERQSATQVSSDLTPTDSVSSMTSGSPSSSRGLFITVTNQSLSTESSSSVVECKHKSVWGKFFTWAAIICFLSIIFSTYTWSTHQLPSPVVSALFDSVSRLLWSLALVGLMVQLCLPDSHTHKLSDLAQLFSSKTCIITGRLSLLVYLWTPYVHTFILAVQEQALFPSLFLIFHVILGNTVITYFVSLVTSVLMEQPIRTTLRNV